MVRIGVLAEIYHGENWATAHGNSGAINPVMDMSLIENPLDSIYLLNLDYQVRATSSISRDSHLRSCCTVCHLVPPFASSLLD